MRCHMASSLALPSMQLWRVQLAVPKRLTCWCSGLLLLWAVRPQSACILPGKGMCKLACQLCVRGECVSVVCRA